VTRRPDWTIRSPSPLSFRRDSEVAQVARQNVTFRIYRRRLLDENRWRASRYGIDGKLIDFGQERETETRSFDSRVHRVCADEIAELGSRREMNHIERIFGMRAPARTVRSQFGDGRTI